jgi:hypothetical protein
VGDGDGGGDIDCNPYKQRIFQKNYSNFLTVLVSLGNVSYFRFLTSESHIWDDNLLTYTGKNIHIFKQVSIMVSVSHSS